MNLKRYRVKNIKEALAFIKRDLGPDALIVSTRQVKEGKGAFGMFGKTMLEVTAAASEAKNSSAHAKAAGTKAVEKYRHDSEISEATIANTFLPSQNKSTLSISDETRKIMLPIKEELKGIRLTLGNLSDHSDTFNSHMMGQLKNELGEMRHMLHLLASRSNSLSEPDLPENLLLLYQQMKFSGLEEKFARRIVLEAQRNMTEDDAENYAYVKIFIARMLMKIIKITKECVISKKDKNFKVIARSDAKSVEGIDKMIDRCKSYVDAGAEIIFPEALHDEKEFEKVRKSLNCYLLANMTEFGKSKLLNYKELENIGYNIVIYPVTTQRLAMKNVEDGLRAIFDDGHQNNIIDKMQTRKRLYDLVEYEKYNSLDEKIYNFSTEGHE